MSALDAVIDEFDAKVESNPALQALRTFIRGQLEKGFHLSLADYESFLLGYYDHVYCDPRLDADCVAFACYYWAKFERGLPAVRRFIELCQEFYAARVWLDQAKYQRS